MHNRTVTCEREKKTFQGLPSEFSPGSATWAKTLSLLGLSYLTSKFGELLEFDEIFFMKKKNIFFMLSQILHTCLFLKKIKNNYDIPATLITY
jgi:hypothetical protein